MKSVRQKLILISFILSLIAAVTVFLYLKSLKSSNQISQNTTILVATQTILSGTLIDKKMVKEIQVPGSSIFDNYIKNSSKVIGKYTKETILKNEGFDSNKLLDESGNQLSVKIDSNCRAISINVTGDSGVSALLKPGDYVDIITYIAEKKDGAKIIREDEAKIVLQDIKVLAVDKQLDREEKTNAKTNDTQKAVTNFLVTLSVKTSDIEKLVLAESIGSIKLALRPLKDDNTTKTNGTTSKELSVSVNSDENAVVSNKDNSSGNYKSYIIKSDDTLKKISAEFYGDANKYTVIKEANNIQDENLILDGEVIKIPILQ